MIQEWFTHKKFYKLPVSAEKKSWRFPYFFKSYSQRKIGTLVGHLVNLINNIVWIHFLDLKSVPSQHCQLSTPPPQSHKVELSMKSKTPSVELVSVLFSSRYYPSSLLISSKMSVALTLLSTSICSKPKRFVVDAIKISSVSDSDRFFLAIS